MNFKAAASLRKWPSLNNERVAESWGGVRYVVAEGTLDICINEFYGKGVAASVRNSYYTAAPISDRGIAGRTHC
jgi:hypothetical protein